jgi:hypothetical protein
MTDYSNSLINKIMRNCEAEFTARFIKRPAATIANMKVVWSASGSYLEVKYHWRHEDVWEWAYSEKLIPVNQIEFWLENRGLLEFMEQGKKSVNAS